MKAQANVTHQALPVSAPRPKAMGTSRQHAPDLMQMREAAAQSPGVLGLHQLQLDAAAYSGAPIQRVVTPNLVPWGPNKGKWKSSETGREDYDTQQDAQAADDLAREARLAAEEDAWEQEADRVSWEFRDLNGRLTAHYRDGWGAKYGIQSHAQLQAYIEQYNADGDSPGQYTIDIGSYGNVKDHHMMRPCTIVYNVWIEQLTVGPITGDITVREVFHCGPSDQ